MMGYVPYGGAAWMMGGMILTGLVLLIAGAVLLRWVLSAVRSPLDRPALRVLEERLARGEIGDEEFRAKRALLLESPRR